VTQGVYAGGPARLDGRVALVTGGSRGIGRAIAERLAARGAALAIVSRSPDESVKELRDRGFDAIGIAADLAGDDPEGVVAGALDHYGRIDVLVYSAGINVRKPALEMSLEEFRAVQKVNVEAAWLTSRACARSMLERSWGRVLFVTSIQSFMGGFIFGDRRLPMTAYTTSKAGMLGMVRGLAKEWASSGIRVNALAPGFVRTELTEPLQNDPHLGPEIQARIPVGHWAEPNDMAEAGAFLCSEEAGYITGQSLTADGGLTI
jgi:2-dehydro-3-deoxy-D-gluconate 5-dehydrogenase